MNAGDRGRKESCTSSLLVYIYLGSVHASISTSLSDGARNVSGKERLFLEHGDSSISIPKSCIFVGVSCVEAVVQDEELPGVEFVVASDSPRLSPSDMGESSDWRRITIGWRGTFGWLYTPDFLGVTRRGLDVRLCNIDHPEHPKITAPLSARRPGVFMVPMADLGMIC
jgi:hypothetical protein